MDGREDERTAIVMERVHGQAQESGQEMSDEDAPVGQVILDWTDERMDVRRSLGMRCVPGQTQTAGWVPRSVESSGLEKWQGKRMELRRSLWITLGVHVQ